MSAPSGEGGTANVAGAAGADSSTNSHRECEGFNGCAAEQVCFTATQCGLCRCKEPQPTVACMTSEGCVGVQRNCVTASECEEPCTCDRVAPVWQTKGQGSAQEVEPVGDGGVVVRIDKAPWFISYDKKGNAKPLATVAAFDSTYSFVGMSDGSLYVAGLSNKSIVVSHLSPTGDTLGAVTWPANFFAFGAIGLGADEEVYLTAKFQPNTIGDDTYLLVKVGADGSPGTQVQLEPQFVPQKLAFNEAGDLLAASPAKTAGIYKALAVALYSKAGKAIKGLTVADEKDSLGDYFGGAAPLIQGGWAYASVERTSLTDNTFVATVSRVGAAGEKVWDVQDVPVGDQMAFAVLDDSILAGLQRFSLGGKPITTVAFAGDTAVVGSAKVGPESVVVLSSTGNQTYSLARLDFPALTRTAEVGDACVKANECPSGSGCCNNICAPTPKCDAGSACYSDADCNDTCYSAPDSAGFCALACTATKDCANDNFCVSGTCRPQCMFTCDHGAGCKDLPDTEGITVSVCSY